MLATVSAQPPSNKSALPSARARELPETGISIRVMPLAADVFASSCILSGSQVLIETSVQLVLGAPPISASSWSVSNTQEKTTSACQTSAAEQAIPPARTRSCARRESGSKPAGT